MGALDDQLPVVDRDVGSRHGSNAGCPVDPSVRPMSCCAIGPAR
jgi:hypothetical protein